MKHVKSSTLISITWMELSTSFRSRSSWISRTLNIDVTNMLTDMKSHSPIPVAVRPVACWDCGFESRRVHGCLSLVSAVCCQVEVSDSGRSLVQRSPTECGVSECGRKASIMRFCPFRGSCAMEKKKASHSINLHKHCCDNPNLANFCKLVLQSSFILH